MNLSRALQLNATVSNIVLAAVLVFGSSTVAPTPASADDMMTQAHTQMPDVAAPSARTH
jgi:hypothetical protein